MCCARRAVNNVNADGAAFRVPALPIEWNGANIGEGLKVPPLGADTLAIRAELEGKEIEAPKIRFNRQSRREAPMSSVQDIYPMNRVTLREVGLRDGLQLVRRFRRRTPSGAGSVMNTTRVCGISRSARSCPRKPSRNLPTWTTWFGQSRPCRRARVALALNERGVNEALASGVAEIASVVSATEEHSRANANRSREAAIANVRRLCELRDASAHKPIVHAAISMALGCSISGEVDPNEVLRLVEKCFEAGVDVVGSPIRSAMQGRSMSAI